MFSLSFFVHKSIVVNSDLNKVKDCISNFDTWKNWSPWLCQEKGCQVNIEGVFGKPGHKQSWKGSRIGEGNMTLTSIGENRYLYDINFVKPFKSNGKVAFEFNKIGEGTEVAWKLEGSVPFFLFFIREMCTVYTGMDFDRGLSMLKDFLETGKVLSDTDVTGVVDLEGFNYLGITKSCAIDEMPAMMEADFKKLKNLMDEEKIGKASQVISLYHVFDPIKNTCKFTSCYCYPEKQESVAGLEAGSFSSHKAAQVVHKGPFKHLGNAWTTVFSYQRAEKLKLNKNIPWYEKYLCNPQEVEENDYVTEINIPVK